MSEVTFGKMEKGEKNGDPSTLEFFVDGKPAGYIESDLEDTSSGMAHVYRVVGYSVFFFHLDNKNDAHFELGRGVTPRSALEAAKKYVAERYSKRVDHNPIDDNDLFQMKRAAEARKWMRSPQRDKERLADIAAQRAADIKLGHSPKCGLMKCHPECPSLKKGSKNPPKSKAQENTVETEDLDVPGLSFAPTVDLFWPANSSYSSKDWFKHISFTVVICGLGDPEDPEQDPPTFPHGDEEDDILAAIERRWNLHDAMWTTGTWTEGRGQNKDCFIRMGIATPSAGDQERLQDDQEGSVYENPPYDPHEVKMGTKVEMEHTNDPKKAEQIAKEHLDEHPDYYSRLKSAGLSNPPVSPEEKRIKREMEDLESQKMKIFFTARDSMFPIPPSATGLYQFPPEMIKIVEKTIKPQITEIDNRLRELRAEKKALKAIKPVRAPKGPSRVVTHLGRCRQCDQKVKFLDRPGVRMDGAGPKQTWVGIACPKCGGALGRTSIDGIKWDEVIDLDARK